MKQDEHLDDIFRNGFNPDFSEEIPHEFLSDLNQRLDKLEQNKKKKRPIAIWWISGIFSLLGVILFAYSFSDKRNLVQNSINSNKPELKIKEISSVKSRGSIDKDSIAKQNNSNEIISGTTSARENKLNGYSIQETAEYYSPIANFSIKNLSFNLENHSASGTKSVNKIKVLEESKVEYISQNHTLRFTDSTTTENDNKTQTALASDGITILTEPTNESKVDSNKNELEKDTTNQNSSQEKTTSKVNNSPQKIKTPSFIHTVSFYSGVSEIMHKVLIPNQDPSIAVVIPNNEYREKRKMEESNITSWDMALHFGFEFRKFTFSSGFDYFVWGERTDYSNVIYNSQFENNYRYINIPFLIGYQFQKGSYGIHPSCGISMGFLAKQVSGYYLSIDNTNSSYQAEINKTIGTFHAGLEFTYFSQSGVKVSLSPIFRQGLSSIVLSDIVRNRYSSMGLQLGIGYRW